MQGRPMSLTRLVAYCSLVAFALALLAPEASATAQSQRFVSVLTIDGIINPPAASYVRSGIKNAEEAGAAAVVLRLDTPGGLDASTRDIVQAIDNSLVPVIVYVWPQGGRAASAGTYIAMAAHVLAMAPGTTIGSATPVSISVTGDVQDLPTDLRNKIVNEAASYIRAHAEIRGRNADWAEQAVREGSNLPASQAVEMNVVDFIARDMGELLAGADGRTVGLGTGEQVTLDLQGVAVRYDGMSFIQTFLHVIAYPDIALILLGLAVLGIAIEIFSPGLIFPGTFGGISLLLALYSLGTLNASWAGIALVLLGFALIIAEAVVPGFGVLGVSGIIALVVGAFVMFAGSPPGVGLSVWTIVGVGIVSVLVLGFFVRKVWEGQRRRGYELGYKSLVGQRGVVRAPLTPEGVVLVFGERWHAHSLEGNLEVGIKVIVERAEDQEIWVRRLQEGE